MDFFVMIGLATCVGLVIALALYLTGDLKVEYKKEDK